MELNCTCFGRRGDIEGGCYDVSSQPDLLKHVLGGEAALWSEGVDRGNFEQAVMMAAGVAAERLWSPRTTLDVQDARHRLGALRTKLMSRGYNAAPLPPVKSDDLDEEPHESAAPALYGRYAIGSYDVIDMVAI
jgi:hypothetical protein